MNSIINKVLPAISIGSLISYDLASCDPGDIYTGKEFNQKFKGPFYKFVGKNGNMINRGYQYKFGRNDLREKFNPSGKCSSGGLYFADKNNIVRFNNFGDNLYEVGVPDDARVYEESCTFKTDSIILKEIESYDIVKHDKYLLRYIKNQTPEICLEAVKQNGRALIYVKNQTPEICLEAVKQNGWALIYVKNQTPEICLEAVKQDGYLLVFVNNQTPEICLEAVKQDGYSLLYVKKINMH